MYSNNTQTQERPINQEQILSEYEAWQQRQDEEYLAWFKSNHNVSTESR